MGMGDVPEQVFIDAARARVLADIGGSDLTIGPWDPEWVAQMIQAEAERPENRAAVASAYRAGQATPDGPRRWASQVPAEPGPDVLAVQIVETGQRWERRYAKDQPDRWAWGHWLLEWSQLLSAWAVGRTLTDAAPAADGQDGRDG